MRFFQDNDECTIIEPMDSVVTDLGISILMQLKAFGYYQKDTQA
jgi:hypothetical protein